MEKMISIQGGRVKYPRMFLGTYLIYGTEALTEREIKVVEARIKGETLEEIGIVLGTTKERVRQIEKRAMAKTVNYFEARNAELKMTKRLLEQASGEKAGAVIDSVTANREELPIEYFTDRISARTANALYSSDIKHTISLYKSYASRELPFLRGIGARGYDECVDLLRHLRYIP